MKFFPHWQTNLSPSQVSFFTELTTPSISGMSSLLKKAEAGQDSRQKQHDCLERAFPEKLSL